MNITDSVARSYAKQIMHMKSVLRRLESEKRTLESKISEYEPREKREIRNMGMFRTPEYPKDFEREGQDQSSLYDKAMKLNVAIENLKNRINVATRIFDDYRNARS